MLNHLKEWSNDLIHLLLPHICTGCGSDLLGKDDRLCLRCLSQLPVTNFFGQPGNPVEQIFYGRLMVCNAAAGFYFTKSSLLQHLIVQLKYKGNKEIGSYLGGMMGESIVESGRFQDVDAIIPLPLNTRKERKRGYNQALMICNGMGSKCGRPVFSNLVVRKFFTETQTHKSRVGRWQNMDGVFMISEPEKLEGKHVLLVDDVVTTGATLEACGQEILKVPDVRLSIATLAYTLL